MEKATKSGLGTTRHTLLTTLKKAGAATIPELADGAELSVETVRHHIRRLEGAGLIERAGNRRGEPGRPEVVYRATRAADDLFPRREGEILRDLTQHLMRSGQQRLIESFFESYIAKRRHAALARVEGLEGAARVEEASRILSEMGFMAEVDTWEGMSHLRLCNCPMRAVVDVTTIPCHTELGFVKELLGGQSARLSHMPAGDVSCTYLAALR